MVKIVILWSYDDDDDADDADDADDCWLEKPSVKKKL